MRDFICEWRENGRAGWQERFRAPINAVGVEEGAARHGGFETTLFKHLKYWHEIDGGEIPNERQFTSSLPTELEGKVSYVDVTFEDPRYFLMIDHPENPIAGLGAEMSDRRLEDFPIIQHARCCAAEYIECRDDRAPQYSLFDQELQQVRRRYVRMMTPLSDRDGNVTRIAYTVRSLQEPRLITD